MDVESNLLVLVVVYLAVGALWSRVYYVRRHRVGWGFDLGSTCMAVIWPVTVITHWSPRLCTHRACVYARAQLRAEHEATDAVIERGLREEGRR